MSEAHESLTVKIVRKFLESNLSIVFILVSLTVGIIALLITPREEDPQLTVPAANVMISFPGRSAQEIEQLVSTPVERMLYQIPGVQYVYSRSLPGQSVISVRFYAGQPLELSYVKILRKLNENMDRITPGASNWVLKPVDVDDVPVVTFTLTSANHDDYALRRMADEILARIQNTDNASVAYVVGGRPRELLIRPSASKMASYRISPLELSRAIQASNMSVVAGSFDHNDENVRVHAGQFIGGARDLKDLVVGSTDNRPVYLREVADVADGPGEYSDYVRFHKGVAWDHRKEEGAAGNLVDGNGISPSSQVDGQTAVTIAVAKKRDTNSVWVAEDLIKRVSELKHQILPADVQVVITRNYGVTANAKVKELEEGMFIAIAVVMALLAIGLGYRQAIVVAIVIPCVFGLTMIVNYLFGFSVNRISLFALTVALGLLVDDPIVDVENIHRHFQLRGKASAEIVLEAVNEVRPPLIAATFAVIFSFLPLLFVTDMMGEYLRPIAADVPVTMFMSLAVSFTITPWLAYHFLKNHAVKKSEDGKTDGASLARKVFEWTLLPLIRNKGRGYVFLGAIVLSFVGSVYLIAMRQVHAKSLPYDNKDEMLLVLDMPVGTTLERTDSVARDFERYLSSVPEITDYEAYIGTSSPVDFNGLMRGYGQRHGANQADIRLNLIHKTERAYASHALDLRLRNDLTIIAQRDGAKLKIVELPAGPPAMSTLVATIYGSPTNSYDDLLKAGEILRARMKREPGVVDVDNSVDENQTKFTFDIDKQKAALNNVSVDDISRTIGLALGSLSTGNAQMPNERNPIKISLWLPRVDRSSTTDLERIYVKNPSGSLIPLSELGTWRVALEDKTINHRQLQRVVYVTGEVSGRAPGEAILDMKKDEVLDRAEPFVDMVSQPRDLLGRTMAKAGGGIHWQVPTGATVKWWDEGELYVTLKMFHDLSLAMAGALIFIYFILMYQTGSWGLPLTIMSSIPLMVIGVLPGFWLLNQIGMRHVEGILNPVFFSGPAFMGMIALAGIVTRNSIIIVDFIHLGIMRGLSLEQSILESVSVRLRPILLTSGAAVLGAIPITTDTVFGGMAWSLIFGLIVSTTCSMFVVPIIYYFVYSGKPDQGLPEHIRKKFAATQEVSAL